MSSTGHLTTLESFYRDRRPTLTTGWGSAYPGFRSFYAEGGWGDEVGGVIEANGGVLEATVTDQGGTAEAAAATEPETILQYWINT